MDHLKIRVEDGSFVELEYRESLSSTVEVAKEYAKAGYPDRYAVFTDTLSAQKKNEKAKKGCFFSLILRPSFFISQSGFLRIQSAAALACALEEHTNERIGIAWLSDIFCNGKKIGYTSVEGKLDEISFFEYVIVTFSAELSEENFPPRLNDLVRKVFENDCTSIPLIVARTVLSKFFSFYRHQKHKKVFLQPYNEHFILRGKRILFVENGKRHRGRAVGLDQNTGTLLLEYRDRTVTVNSPKNIVLPKRLRFKK